MLEEMVRVGKKNVIVIPSNIRKKVGIQEGDLLRIRVEGEKILLEKLSAGAFSVLAEVIGEPYEEEVDEKRAEEWLKKGR
ncbi:MAG: AbrB/MazE/SpoVT family DNA-binding domain-containing protein [Candidatus Jordarchaeales archaeon]